jgi:CDP-glucose 4,6-dehydratase
VKTFARAWGVQGIDTGWIVQENEQLHEAGYLLLDSSKARQSLGWSDNFNFQETVELTCSWYQNIGQAEAKRRTMSQIENYLNI